MNDTTWYVCIQENYLDVRYYTSKTCVLIETAVGKPSNGENWATIFRPWFKCVRKVKQIEGLLHCTSKHYDQIGIAFRHILRINDVVQGCFDIHRWISYQHHFLRDGTPERTQKFFQDITGEPSSWSSFKCTKN